MLKQFNGQTWFTGWVTEQTRVENKLESATTEKNRADENQIKEKIEALDKAVLDKDSELVDIKWCGKNLKIIVKRIS